MRQQKRKPQARFPLLLFCMKVWRLVAEKTFKNGLNEVVDRSLVIWIRTGSHSVGDDRANGDGVVAHHFCHTLKCGALHFIVGDVAAFVFKLLDALVEFWFSKWQAHFTTLWTVEAHSRDGVASHHVVAADFFNQSWV